MSSAICFNLDQSRILSSGNGLNDLNNFFKSLSNDKVVGWSNFKAFADDKIYVTVELKFVLGRVENVLGKGKNAGY